MVTSHPSNSIFKSEGSGQYLSFGNDLIVDQGIVISSSDMYGVNAEGSNTITCNGVIAGGYFGVATASSIELDIGLSGTVTGRTFGVDVNFGTVVTNDGTIFGGTIGAALRQGATIINSGSILSGEGTAATNSAIYLVSGGSVVINSGTIQSRLAVNASISSSYSDPGADTILNSGTIKGFIVLGGGNDKFTNTTGKVVMQDGKTPAVIDGGPGDDRFYLGASIEAIKGGSDKDYFYFKTKPDVRVADHILDFTHGEDHIGLSKTFFKLDPGQTVADAFKDITAGNKYDADDHIIYNANKGALYYDVDGYGGAAPVAFAILDSHPTNVSASDFFLA